MQTSLRTVARGAIQRGCVKAAEAKRSGTLKPRFDFTVARSPASLSAHVAREQMRACTACGSCAKIDARSAGNRLCTCSGSNDKVAPGSDDGCQAAMRLAATNQASQMYELI